MKLSLQKPKMNFAVVCVGFVWLTIGTNDGFL